MEDRRQGKGAAVAHENGDGEVCAEGRLKGLRKFDVGVGSP